jgi:hypothetical protein
VDEANAFTEDLAAQIIAATLNKLADNGFKLISEIDAAGHAAPPSPR